MLEKLITYETLRRFAYCNDAICKKPIRGIVLSFFGLGGMKMFSEDPEEAIFYAERGILYLIPYNNPWAWMNSQAVAYTDELLDVLFTQYELDPKTPIVSTGGSMGGLSALVYTAYAARTPVACVANCPVCDLVYHYGERPDLPRTLYSAFWHEEGTVEQAIEKASPLHLAAAMPDVVYHVFHCGADQAVNLQMHSERFVAAMRAAGKSVTFDIVPERGHCDLTEDAWKKFREFVLEAIL